MSRATAAVCACNGFAVHKDDLQWTVMVERANGIGASLGYIGLGCKHPALLVERIITEHLFNTLPALEFEPVKGIKGEARKPIEERNGRKIRARWDREHNRMIEGSAANTAAAVANAFLEATCETPSSTKSRP